MKFDFVDLRLFVNVCNAGSITGGAANSYLTLQSASERIKNIENILGIPLLIRSKSGVELTEIGHIFLQHAVKVLQDVEHMRSELFRYSKELHGCILLACNSSALNEHLPDRVGDFLSLYPHISLSLEEKLSLDIVHGIKNRTIDLGIVSDTVNLEGLQQLPFYDDKLVLVVATNHPLAKLTEVAMQDVILEQFVGLMEHLALQRYIEGQVKQLGRSLSYRVRLASFESVCQVVAKGVGVAVIPLITAQRIQLKNLQIVALTDQWAKRKLVICSRCFEKLPRYYLDFVDFLLAKEC